MKPALFVPPQKRHERVAARVCAFTLPLLMLGLVAGCNGDGSDGQEEGAATMSESAGSTGDESLGSESGSSSSGVAGACGPTELCTRSIEDCGLEWELAQCEAYYDDDTQCADFDAYVECNCQCLGEETCDDYYGCGSICFEDHC